MPKESKNRNNINIEKTYRLHPTQAVESSESEEENIEVRPNKKYNDVSSESDHEDIEPVPVAKPKKQASEKQLASMKKAQQVRLQNLQAKKEQDEEARRLIERSYKAEVEQQLTKTMLPKYSRKIKKEILSKLQAKKLIELKKQYGYKTESESDDDSSSSSSEDEPLPVLKRSHSKKPKVYVEPVKQVKRAKEKQAPTKQVGILQKFRDMGF